MNKEVIYPSMVIRSQAEVIELLEKENKELKRNCNIGNENLKFYKEENTQLKSVIKEIREYIEDARCGDYCDAMSAEDLLQILDKGDKNDFKGS